jgi:hypothetical protein
MQRLELLASRAHQRRPSCWPLVVAIRPAPSKNEEAFFRAVYSRSQSFWQKSPTHPKTQEEPYRAILPHMAVPDH